MDEDRLETLVEIANDYVQQAASADMAAGYLAGCSTRILKGVCDLNYLDENGGRMTLIRRILADRFGE